MESSGGWGKGSCLPSTATSRMLPLLAATGAAIVPRGARSQRRRGGKQGQVVVVEPACGATLFLLFTDLLLARVGLFPRLGLLGRVGARGAG